VYNNRDAFSRRMLAQVLEQLETIHARDKEIQQDDLWPPRDHALNGLIRILGGRDLVNAEIVNHFLDVATILWIIVNHQ